MRDFKSSMLYWYPKVAGLPIPQPLTRVIPLTESEIKRLERSEGIDVPKRVIGRIRVFAEVIGVPFFLRTDYASAKHEWNKTCFVSVMDFPDRIVDHVRELVLSGMMVDIIGLPCNALVMRAYLKMDGTFTAFMGKLPINSERRYFIRNGKVECHHPYWFEEAIARFEKELEMYNSLLLGNTIGRTHLTDLHLPEDWRDKLKALNFEGYNEIALLAKYAETVGYAIGNDYWSIDFCRGESGTWYLIDIAEGEKSEHYPTCQYAPKRKVEEDD